MPGVDLDQLEKLLEFMTAHGLEEFEYEHGGLHIRLRKAGSAAKRGAAGTRPRNLGVSSSRCRRGPVLPKRTRSQCHPPVAAPVEELHIIKSPIVGTFYGAPSPDAPPFVNPGRHRPRRAGALHRRSHEIDE